MRIRKNAKLSPLMFSHASGPEALQTHVCQLNQSPWDVIAFSQESSYPSTLHQFEVENSFTGNGSLGDSIGAVESSVASMMDREELAISVKVDEMVIDDNETGRVGKTIDANGDKKIGKELGFKKGGKLSLCCNKTDGKGWQCRNEPKEGHSLCEHHLNLLKSYTNNSSSLNSPSSAARRSVDRPFASRRGRARLTARKGSSSNSNPYEFYYYSGFGPLWGKRRSDRNGEGSKGESKDADDDSIIAENNTNTPPSTSPQIENEEFDYVDEDDDEEEENGRKRMRKPVKARSLKSLM